MSIRWDSLLVRHLARELEERLAGERLRAVRLDGRTRDAALLFRECSLVWRLHPNRSTILLRPPVEPAEGDHRFKARLRRVRAPDDERIIHFELAARGGLEVIVELIGNQLNAVVVEGGAATIRHVLVRREGRRPVSVGRAYAPPEPTEREGIAGDLPLDAWLGILEPVPPPERPRELMRRIAWSSPLNAEAFLAGRPADSRESLARGHRAWKAAVDDTTGATPVILHTDRGAQPYPLPLVGCEHRPADSLLEAFRTCADEDEADEGVGPALAVPPALLRRLEDAIEHAERRLVRLQAELEAREDPDALRAVGDLILARYAELPGGAESVTLTGFDGEPVAVALDPGLPPHDNAAEYYDRAGRSERAAERIPELMAKAREHRDRLASLLAAATEGTVDLEEVRAALPRTTTRSPGDDAGPTLPYRTFRSSGGLEIRVGRGAKHNDDLTFRHSSPSDIWLHARHTAGAHVILRWQSDDNPPPRDLAQAGTLAALHSKARTSASVPVDWTRRKYVRKPRGSAPGSVVPDRVETIFVRPDEGLLERLTDDG